MNSAAELGWNEAQRGPLEPEEGHGISRVAVAHRGAFELIGPYGAFVASLEPSLRRRALSPLDFPAVGDWVSHELVESHDRRVALTSVLERGSVVVRRSTSERPLPQVVAANVDVMGVVTTAELLGTGADSASGYRLERYLVAAAQGGVRTVLVVNKSDLAGPDLDGLRQRFPVEAGAVEVLTTSAFTGAGISDLAALTTGGSTLALAGASGVGKSSLVNRLLGSEVVEVGEVGSGGRGRHTTIRRELFVVPVPQKQEQAGPKQAGTVIDTPGLADLVPWIDPGEGYPGLDQVFADVDRFAQHCCFNDCQHRHEPNCAVVRAVAAGELQERRLNVYRSLAEDALIQTS